MLRMMLAALQILLCLTDVSRYHNDVYRDATIVAAKLTRVELGIERIVVVGAKSGLR